MSKLSDAIKLVKSLKKGKTDDVDIMMKVSKEFGNSLSVKDLEKVSEIVLGKL